MTRGLSLFSALVMNAKITKTKTEYFVVSLFSLYNDLFITFIVCHLANLLGFTEKTLVFVLTFSHVIVIIKLSYIYPGDHNRFFLIMRLAFMEAIIFLLVWTDLSERLLVIGVQFDYDNLKALEIKCFS